MLSAARGHRRPSSYLAVVSSLATALCARPTPAAEKGKLRLNEREYFSAAGVDVMAFQDVYPEGHQGGVGIIQQGVRVATNGDLRLEPAPGQWAPVPVQKSRIVDRAQGAITATLAYPDPDKDRRGFNPIAYPDLHLTYQVRVRAEGAGVRITVDLAQPLPPSGADKVGFNLELYPAALFGKTFYAGDHAGVFPRQPNGPGAGGGPDAELRRRGALKPRRFRDRGGQHLPGHQHLRHRHDPLHQSRRRQDGRAHHRRDPRAPRAAGRLHQVNSTLPIQLRRRRARRVSRSSPSTSAVTRRSNAGATSSNALTLTTA